MPNKGGRNKFWRNHYGTPDEARKIALGAVRSHLRLCDIDPGTASVKIALRALDELQSAYPGKICAKFSEFASITQINLFVRDWKRWLKEANEMREAKKYEQLAK